MTRKKTAEQKEQMTIVVNDKEDRKGKLKGIGGSQSDKWNHTLVEQVLETLRIPHESKREELYRATVAALMGIAPRDELEGMMATQLIAAHQATMECYRLAMIGEQTFEGWRESLNQANKLSRTWATLLDALNKHRGKGQQKVTVEHVHVHAGGQAVVGNVGRPGGGGGGKSEEQPHAKQSSDALEPALRCPDTEGGTLPITCDGERPMSDARGSFARRAERQHQRL